MSEHIWWQWGGLTCCKTCGIVRRRDGKNRPCKGPTKVEIRQELGELIPGGIYFSHVIRGVNCDVQAAMFCDGVPDYLVVMDESTGDKLDLTDEEYEAVCIAAERVYCNRGPIEPFDPLDYCPGGMKPSGPSKEWLKKMAELEDGKCTSVGGLAVELGLYRKDKPSGQEEGK